MNIFGQYLPELPNTVEVCFLPQLPADAMSGALLSAQICMNVTPAIIEDGADALLPDPVPLDGI